MKLKLIPRKRLVSTRRSAAGADAVDETAAYSPSGASAGERRENLYRAIERTQAFLHKSQSPEGFMADLRRRYPSPQYFVESSRQSLERAGLSRLDAFYYAMIPSLTRTSLSQQWGEHPRLDALCRIRDYVVSLYVGRHVECVYLILLDRRGRLIRPVLLQRGVVDNAPFYLSQLLTVALREEARFLVLAHNHPGGTKRPSREDLICTLKTLNAFAPLRIPLLDHIIVAGEEAVSIRQAGLIPAMLWSAALPGSRIVSEWLNDKLNNS